MGVVWLILALIPLILGAWWLARDGFEVEAGSPRILASAVVAWGWVTVGMELLGTLGRLDRIALVGWSVGGLALAGLIVWSRGRRESPSGITSDTPARTGPGLVALIGAVIVVWAALRVGLVSMFQPVKVVSDGPIYHLYFAARWWKAERIFPVATPFGEVGATYFWANGELWYTWLMALYGGDRFARVGQVPFLGLIGTAVVALGRRLKVGEPASWITAFWYMAAGPLFLFTFEPNVDTILIAGYLIATYFFVQAGTEAPEENLRSLILGSLAAGLGMGTKPTGIVFFPPLIGLMLGLCAWRSRTWRSFFRSVTAAVVPGLAMMAYWPVRNALWTGNPLYPLQVEAFGRVWLAGWFGPEAMKKSTYYIPFANWRAGGDLMMQVIDPREFPFWVAAMVGGWAWARPRPVDFVAAESRKIIDRWVWALTALGAFNLAAYWFLIPYRTQQRFALPGLALITVSLAKLFDRGPWLQTVAVVVLLLHLTTPAPWPVASSEETIPWDLASVVPNFLPGALPIPMSRGELSQQWHEWRLAATIILLVVAVGVVWVWNQPRRPPGRGNWLSTTLVMTGLVPLLVTACWCLSAFETIPFPRFADYNSGLGRP